MVPLGHERARWLGRAAGQASVYLVFALAGAALLHREGVLRRDVLTPRTLVVCAVVWVLLVAYRAVQERAA